MKIVYEVRIVEMDEQFNNSVSDETSGYVSKSEAKKIYKKWLDKLKKNPPQKNCYICVESFRLNDDGFVDEWLNSTSIKEFRVNSSRRV